MASSLINNQTTNTPLTLLVPGYAKGGASDWMAAWEQRRPDSRRLDLGQWDAPHRNTWVNKLNLAIHHADRPVVLVAHDIGCLAVAWWVEYERPDDSDPVIGALLVAPPDVDRPGADPRLAPFGACPRQQLPFPCFVVADSRADQPKLVTATQLASDWGSLFKLDEIDAYGWDAGHNLLSSLLRERRPTARPVDQPKPAISPLRVLASI